MILCMGAGFPNPDCTDAHAYMLDRIRHFDPLPPFRVSSLNLLGLIVQSVEEKQARHIAKETGSAHGAQ